MSAVQIAGWRKTARKHAHDYLAAREQEVAEARQCAEELKRSLDQGSQLGFAHAMPIGESVW